jgi:hypothetical protein
MRRPGLTGQADHNSEQAQVQGPGGAHVALLPPSCNEAGAGMNPPPPGRSSMVCRDQKRKLTPAVMPWRWKSSERATLVLGSGSLPRPV